MSAFRLQPPTPFGLAVLISGGGTTLRNLLAKIGEGQLRAEILLVVSSNSQARGLDYAREAGIRTAVIERDSFPTTAEYSQAVFDHCSQSGAWLVAMAGFLKHVLVPEGFTNRVLNIHPALIPGFCGK